MPGSGTHDPFESLFATIAPTVDPASNAGVFMRSLRSARTRLPTTYYVDAIEPSELLMITLPDFDRLLERFPDVARGYQLGLERTSAARERRITLALNSTAEERYADFVARHPAMAARIPQRMLASYLGITPETLSRVRRRRRAPRGKSLRRSMRCVESGVHSVP
ncbi:MAG: Crp/Fnr family transcriptional regulator [Gemmatimonadaceae bacterium]